MPAPRHRAARGRTHALARVAVTAAVTVAGMCGLRTFVAQNFTIPSASMTNTLRVGDQIMVDKVGWRVTGLRRGDVVVFDGAGSFDPAGQHTDYVKRIIGLPGDTVACCDAGGRVTVNGKPLHEPYVHSDDHAPFGPLLVPAGQLFMLGDHRSDSDDSRYQGTVPVTSVVGRVAAVIWPLTHARLLPQVDPSAS